MLQKIFNFLTNHYKLTAFVCGMLSALAFAPTYAVVFFIVLLALLWKITDNVKSCSEAAGIGYLYGFGLFMVGFYWVGNALLIDAGTFGWLYPITLFGAGAFFGIFTILPFVVWHLLPTIFKKISGFAATWVLLEWLRSFILTGFPWNLAGTMWAFNPIFIQTAAVWGTYGLSFLTFLLVGGVYLLLRRQWVISSMILVGISALLYSWGVYRIAQYNHQESDITIRLVQPSIPQQMKWNRQMMEDNLNRYVSLSRKDGFEKVDFVIWGETAVPFDPLIYKMYEDTIKIAIPSDGYLISGVIREGAFNFYNSLYVLDKDFELRGFYDKNHLVPFGEYIPFREYLPRRLRPVANNIADLGIGEKYKNIRIDGFPQFGGLICYEIIFPDEVINRQDKPQWLVVLSNDGWYGKSSGPYQHLAATQLRAVEEGITIVRSANTGISAVINPLGEIVRFIPLEQEDFMDVKLPVVSAVKTPYNQYGRKLPVFILFLFLLFLFTTSGCIGRVNTKNN